MFENPEAAWEHAAFSQVTRGANVGTFAGLDTKKTKAAGPIMGRSIRIERWRYTEWDAGRAGAELYDHEVHPRGMKNLAAEPRRAALVTKLSARLRAGGK